MRSVVYSFLFLIFLNAGISSPHAAGEKSGEEKSSKARPEHQPELLDTLFWTPEIVVEGIRTEPSREIMNKSGFVGLVEIDKKENSMADPVMVLARCTGVNIRQYGGLGSFATMSIRGSSSAQVGFYLDGVPLSDAYSGMTNLADFSLGDISSIEIYRGFSPAGFGASSIGGTVNLVSADSNGPTDAGIGISGRAAGGSFGSRRYSLSAGSVMGRFDLRAFGGYTESSGDFSFLDDNATPENILDDETSTRTNNDFQRWNLTGRIRTDLPVIGSLSLHHNSFIRKGGLPGPGADQESSARLERQRRMTYIKAAPSSFLSGRIHPEATAFYSWTAERFNDPAGDIDLSSSSTDNRILSWGGNLRTKIYPRSFPVSFDLFVENRMEKYRPASYLPVATSGPDRNRKTTSLTFTGNLFLLHEILDLSFSQRSEWYENEFHAEPPFPWIPPTPVGKIRGDKHTPAFGFRFRPTPSITFKGNYGSYYRIPTFFELFGNLGTVTGESDLSPESGINRDIGVIFTPGKAGFINEFFFEATYLYNETDDLILFFPNSQSTVRPQNIGKARVRGIELSSSGKFPAGFVVSGNYAWLDSRDVSPIPYYNGNELPGRPVHKASLTIEYFRSKWSLAWQFDHMGSNYLNRYNTRETGSRDLHNMILVTKPFLEGLSLTIEAYNLTDRRTADVSGFPLPGRSFYASLNFKL
ncbi:MAG: TonB-dependent receptor [Bacteroidales bacterium]|nr:TonB-dependent receptor [Candidatus Latescibacterota bacterium]